MIHFYKYQGTGNDFVMIDDRNRAFNPSVETVSHLCNRRFGIGGDGLILLQNNTESQYKMVYYNANGSEGSMCGNGGRCFVQFVSDLGLIKNKITFMAVDGIHDAVIDEKGFIALKMKDVDEVKAISSDYFCDTGSPHLVIQEDNLKNMNVVEKGRNIRYSQQWQEKGGTNVNFWNKVDPNAIAIRTYERGVEDETLSCGTGATACALVANAILAMKSPVKVKVEGGDLEISFEKESTNYHNIWLKGPAVKVFEGKVFF